MSEARGFERDQAAECRDPAPKMCPPSETDAEVIELPRTARGCRQSAMEELATRQESLEARLDSVTAEHETVREGANKLRKQLLILQALVRGGGEPFISGRMQTTAHGG